MYICIFINICTHIYIYICMYRCTYIYSVVLAQKVRELLSAGTSHGNFNNWDSSHCHVPAADGTLWRVPASRTPRVCAVYRHWESWLYLPSWYWYKRRLMDLNLGDWTVVSWCQCCVWVWGLVWGLEWLVVGSGYWVVGVVGWEVGAQRCGVEGVRGHKLESPQVTTAQSCP